MSWTPNEFRSFCRGAQHAQVDEYDRMATAAMFNRYAMNAKSARKNRMFNAQEAHDKIDRELDNWKKSSGRPRLSTDLYKRIKAGFNQSITSFQKKGGKP